MNSYNENLHSTVVNSLQSLDLEEQNLKSQVNASMFTLYHAEGATITAEQNLVAARTSFAFNAAVKDQAVKDSNLSINLLSSANQANQYLKQSVTNVAVCASNVQIAANAIVRLASDMGSIFSIVNAADYDSDIYIQADTARELMNETAYDAEVASQLAMEASMLTAVVSSATVLDMATATNGLMTNLLKLASADFDASTKLIAADNEALAGMRSSEKLAEGALEVISVDYKATKSAYELSNKELNLNLRVIPSTTADLSFTVNFDLIQSPFPSENPANVLYPVKDYYMIVVKESKKQTFSISNAENILLKNAADAATNEVISVVLPETSSVSQQVNVYNTSKIGMVPVTDSDNEEIKLGVSYVVFVMAIYADEYKRKINTYDDYLSAPSQAFTLTSPLDAVDAGTMTVVAFDKANLSEEELAAADSSKNEQQLKNAADIEDSTAVADYTYVLRFNATDAPDLNVEYRCMLLPYSTDITDSLLTSESLQFLLDEEIASLEQISNEFDPKIAEYQSAIYDIILRQELANAELKDLNDQLDFYAQNGGEATGGTAEKEEELKQNQAAVTAKLQELTANHTTNSNALKDMLEQKEGATQSMTAPGIGKPGFLFNLTLAEQVFAESYTVAKKLLAVVTATSGSNSKKKSDTTDAAVSETQWIAFFGPDTTDNFGNRLNTGENYIPVILSYSTAAAENAAEFVNALSDIKATDYFQY